MGLFELRASDLLAGYAAGTFSPVEVTRAVIARREGVKTLNAFVVFDADVALAEARTSEERWRRGAPRGLLDGVPVSLKDLLLVRGWPTRAGSRTAPSASPGSPP